MKQIILHRGIRASAAALALCLTFSCASLTGLADERTDAIERLLQQEQNAQQAISQLEKQAEFTRDAINSLEDQKQETMEQVDSLQSQSDSLNRTIRKYNGKLEELNEEIDYAEEEMSRISSNIVQLEKELQEARANEKERYALLKLRMKSMYESGGTSGMLETLLESGSLRSLMTRVEYLNAIVDYDNRVIREFRELQKQIEEKVAEVRLEEKKIDEYQGLLDEKHRELSDLASEVNSELHRTNSNINVEKEKLDNYDTLLEQLDQQMKALEAQTAAAQAQLAQSIAARLELQREDTSGSYAASGDELSWLAATIQAEAGGESYTGKLAVGSVIMNRVKSSAFPNSIVGVITQNMQFASYRSGKVEAIMARGPSSACIQAAQEVLGGARVGDYLFFMTKYYADYYRIADYTMIGNHAFFYRWVTKSADTPPAEEPAEAASEETEAAADTGSADQAAEGSGESQAAEENTANAGNEEASQEEASEASENTEEGASE